MHEQLPGVRVIVLTAFDTDDQIVGAVRAGAKGYLLKGVPRAEIFNAIRVVHAGGSLLQPIVTSKLMLSLEHDSQSRTPPVETLTERETEVLRCWHRAKRTKRSRPRSSSRSAPSNSTSARSWASSAPETGPRRLLPPHSAAW